MHGGKREGAGRPKSEPTTTIRVPVKFKERIKAIIKAWMNEQKEGWKQERGYDGDDAPYILTALEQSIALNVEMREAITSYVVNPYAGAQPLSAALTKANSILGES